MAAQAAKKGGGHLAALSWPNLWLSCCVGLFKGPLPFHPQLTDPVVPFHLYDAFISLAKTLHADPVHDPGTPSPSPEVIRSLKTLLVQLPDSNYSTLRHLVAHLFRCALSLILTRDF